MGWRGSSDDRGGIERPRREVERWGRDGRAYADYTGTLRRLLETDPEVRAARAAWRDFLVASHGDVLGDLPLDDPATETFVDAAYYDCVVDRLTAAVERATGVALANRGLETDGDANPNDAVAPPDLRALHDRVRAAGADVPTVDGVSEVLLDAAAEAAEAGAATEAQTGDRSPADGSDAAAGDDDPPPAALRTAGTGLLAGLYGVVVRRPVRRALGEYYTPRGVAELAVDALDVADPASATVLDPGCGSGVFLAVCADRAVAALAEDDSRADGDSGAAGSDSPPDEILATVTRLVRGVDVNPVAVGSAKLRYLLALAPVLAAADAEAVTLPVAHADALGLAGDGVPAYGAAHAPDGDPTVDHLVGNPPWLPWGRLSETVRERWRDRYVEALDLLPHDGAAARLGHANDDVSVLYAWVCVHRYLRAGGRAAFVLKRSATKGPAGKLLRQLRVGDRPLALARVHAFEDLRPFGRDARADAAIYSFVADADHQFPVPATVWRAGDAAPDFSTTAALRTSLAAEETGLVPVDPDEPASAWVREDAERAALGECAHDVRHGVKDDAAAVYGLDRDQLADVEPDLVYPYLKSRHVRRYGVDGHDLRLVPQRTAGEDNEARLREQFPGTYAYLRAHRERLAARSSSWLDDGPFYAVFGLGDYTWADYKVVWCRLGFRPEFAVVSTVADPDLGEKPVVPGDHYMFVATDDEREAHLLCALLNSAPYRRSLRALADGGKASLTKAVVSELRLPEWPTTEVEWPGPEAAERLAELSMTAHEVVAGRGGGAAGRSGGAAGRDDAVGGPNDDLGALQAEMDRLVEELLAA